MENIWLQAKKGFDIIPNYLSIFAFMKEQSFVELEKILSCTMTLYVLERIFLYWCSLGYLEAKGRAKRVNGT